MGELLTHDGGGRAEAGQYGHGERRSDGQTVDEVVQCVAEGNHPRHRPDPGDALAAEPVAHHIRHLDILEEWHNVYVRTKTRFGKMVKTNLANGSTGLLQSAEKQLIK